MTRAIKQNNVDNVHVRTLLGTLLACCAILMLLKWIPEIIQGSKVHGWELWAKKEVKMNRHLGKTEHEWCWGLEQKRSQYNLGTIELMRQGVNWGRSLFTQVSLVKGAWEGILGLWQQTKNCKREMGLVVESIKSGINLSRKGDWL